MTETQQENLSKLEALLSLERLKDADLRAQQTINRISNDLAQIYSLKNDLFIRKSMSSEPILNHVTERINYYCIENVFSTRQENKIDTNDFLEKAVYLEKVLNGLYALRDKYDSYSFDDNFLKNILDKQIEQMKNRLNMNSDFEVRK